MKINLIGNSNIHYRFYTWDFFLEKQRNIGLQRIDLFGADPHVLIDCYSISTNAKELREKAEDSGMKIQTFTPEFSSFRYALGREGKAQDKSWEYVKRSFDFAKIIETPKIIFSINGFLLDRRKEECWGRTERVIEELDKLSIEYDIDVLIGNHYEDQTDMVRTIEDMRCCMEWVNGGRIYPAVDTASVFHGSETLEKWFEIFGDKISHVNLSNTKFDGMRHCWGDGYLNLYDLMRVLDEHKYRGTLGTSFMVREYLSKPWEADEKTREMLEVVCTDEG